MARTQQRPDPDAPATDDTEMPDAEATDEAMPEAEDGATDDEAAEADPEHPIAEALADGDEPVEYEHNVANPTVAPEAAEPTPVTIVEPE